MFANYDYYVDNFKGTKIKSEDEYINLSIEASKYIEKYTNVKTCDTKNCECAIVEYLQMSKKQGNLTSENIPNFYSASWSANDKSTREKEINSILELYLGDLYSAVGIVKVIN